MPNDAQRSLLAEWQEISKAQFERYADAWQAGRIGLADFQRLAKAEIKDLYIAATWTATGSPEDTSFADYGRAGRRLRDQYQFLGDFFGEIEAGDLSLEQVKARLNLYAASSTQVLEEVGISGEGLPRLPAYPGDGSTHCRTNCKCAIEWEEVAGGYDVHWRLNPAEHCPDCLRRSRAVLRVRGGRVVNPEVWE